MCKEGSGLKAQSLDGWVACNGTAPLTVEDGAIVGRAVLKSPNSFLCTQEAFGDVSHPTRTSS